MPQLKVSDDTWDITDDLIVPSIDLDFSKLDSAPTYEADMFATGKEIGGNEMLDFEVPSKGNSFAFREGKQPAKDSFPANAHQPPFAGRGEWSRIHTELKKDLKIGNFALKVQSREVWWCDSVYAIFELNPKVVAPSLELFSKLVHPADKDVVCFLMDRAMKQAVPFEITYRVRLQNKKIKWSRFMCRVQYDARTRRVDKLVGTIQDITQWSNSVKSMAQSSKSNISEGKRDLNSMETVDDESQLMEDATCIVS